MRQYLRVYKTLLSLNFSTLIIYRANFFNNLIASLSWGIFVMVQMFLLTYRTSQVFGWTRDEILFLTSVFTVMIGIFHTFFSPNFERLSHSVNLGNLDTVLIKPIDDQFLASCWYVVYTPLSRVLFGVPFMIYFLNKLGISPSLFHIILFLCLFFCGLLLLYSIWVWVITLTIWYPRLSNLVELMYNITGMARYPGEMYRGTARFISFFIFPLLFVVIAPAKILLQKATFIDIVILLVLTGVIFLSARKFWQFALKFYTSTSS